MTLNPSRINYHFVTYSGKIFTLLGGLKNPLYIMMVSLVASYCRRDFLISPIDTTFHFEIINNEWIFPARKGVSSYLFKLILVHLVRFCYRMWRIEGQETW